MESPPLIERKGTLGKSSSILKRNAKSFNETLTNHKTMTVLEPDAVKQGWLYKRGGGRKSNAWRLRWFVLTGPQLYYFKTDKEKKPKGVINPLTSYVIEEEEGEGKTYPMYCFRITPKPDNLEGLSRVFHIYASTQSEMIDWMEVLHQASAGGRQVKAVVEIEEKLRRNYYDIPKSDLEWNFNSTSLIGKGASGVVKKGLWLKTTDVAVKALNNLPEFTDAEETASFYKEIETLSQLRHPNIVPMFGYCKKDGFICLVTEFVSGGNLFDLIYDQSKVIDLGRKLDLCISICRGMVYLHSKNVMHRDLKPQNILVENWEEGKVKVCDFGLSAVTKKGDEQVSKEFGSPAYAAPELQTSNHTNKVDVFSFATIMWEIYFQKSPWVECQSTWQISEKVGRGERLPFPQDQKCILQDLITRCWAANPNDRPTFAEIYDELIKIRTSVNPGLAPSQSFLSLSAPSAPSSPDPSPSPQQQQQPQPPKPVKAPVAPLPVLKQETYEAQISRLFHNQSALPWKDFAKTLQIVLGAPMKVIEQLKFLLSEKEMVGKTMWDEFLKWFSPLAQTDYYQTNSTGLEQEGYFIEEIADIVGLGCFFGFMSPVKAKEVLLSKPMGAFLFRFSTTPGCYTLSVNYGQVGHWRIQAEKIGTAYPTFKIDGKTYRSLHEIIETHKVGGAPLKVKSTTIHQCYLTVPVDRNDFGGVENIYETMY